MEQLASEKETRLATALRALPEPELAAYRYFVRHKQPEISEDKAEELFKLYQRGSTCAEIRRLFPQFTFGQVVASRVMRAWDDRKIVEVKNLQVEVPARVETAHLETQEFLANLLHASNRRFSDALKLYIATGDVKQLEGVPLPRNVKDLRDVVELYMKMSGTDTKRVEVSVKGGVKHSVERVKPEEAEGIMDDLLADDEEPVDAEFTEVKPDSEPAALAPIPKTAITSEEMTASLVKAGMPLDRAQKVVASLKAKSEQVGGEIASALKEISEGSKEPLN